MVEPPLLVVRRVEPQHAMHAAAVLLVGVGRIDEA